MKESERERGMRHAEVHMKREKEGERERGERTGSIHFALWRGSRNSDG